MKQRFASFWWRVRQNWVTILVLCALDVRVTVRYGMKDWLTRLLFSALLVLVIGDKEPPTEAREERKTSEERHAQLREARKSREPYTDYD